MTTDPTQPTVDEAVTEFMHNLGAELAALPPAPPRAASAEPETEEEAEARYYRAAEVLLRQICPDPSQCRERRCRRASLCQHLAALYAAQSSPPAIRTTRRTPGAEALRHAIWLFQTRF